MKKVYISGQISDIPYTLAYMNFKEAEQEVIDLFGYSPVNPVMLGVIYPHFTYDDYIAIDKALIDSCDAVYMLQGWEQSKGARIEKEYAEVVGKKILYQLPKGSDLLDV